MQIKKETFTMRIDKDTLELIRELATKENRSMNYIVSEIIEEYFEKYTK